MTKLMGVALNLLCVLMLCACSSAPRKQEGALAPVTATKPDSQVVNEAQKAPVVQNLDIAHESFIYAQEMELRGEKQMAEIFWQRAYDADPENRFLAFAVAGRMFAHGEDSAALALAQKAVQFKGVTSASQYALMAQLYVKEANADSARKYFKAALELAHGQDMHLLYDYSLFLEAVQDKKELVKVYDQLLPQLNYIQSLFARQLNLLAELKKDSAIVDLFGKAHEATGDKELLAEMVRCLMIQKRFAEARAIADTITGDSKFDDEIIQLALQTFAFPSKGKSKEDILAFLKKKVNGDGLRSPYVLFLMGNYEYSLGMRDSARVHLESAYPKLDSAYAPFACQTLSFIAFAEDRFKDGVRYAWLTDSLQVGGNKEFLAGAYGVAGMYKEAYFLLDSLLGVWSHWTPMEGIADSATMSLMRSKAEAAYRRLQDRYAVVLINEARSIEDKGGFDSLKLAHAKEARARAQLFWESMLMSDSTNLSLLYSMACNLERMGRYDESFKIFESLLARTQEGQLDWPEVMNYFGYSLIEENRTPEEVEKGYTLVLKAIELSGNEVPEAFLDSKAWGLYRKGEYAEALAVMQQIKEKNFLEDYVYWEHVGAIHAALGRRAEAIKAYKKVLKLHPGHERAREFLGKKK